MEAIFIKTLTLAISLIILTPNRKILFYENCLYWTNLKLLQVGLLVCVFCEA